MYPSARRSDHVDTYFNTPVPDPYRWMEDVDSPEVEAWVSAENTLTRSVLDTVPGREPLRERLLALTNFERFSAPTVRNNRFVYAHNTGLQNQVVLLWQDGPHGEPHLLLDPNTLSPDGTIALAGLALSPDGALLAFALSEAGSDWITWHIKEIGTGPGNSSPDLPDQLTRSKFSSASWLPDSSGFVYSGYGLPAIHNTDIATEVEGSASPAGESEAPSEEAVIPTEDEAQRSRSGETPASAPAQPTSSTPVDLKSTQRFHQVFLHTLGTPQSADPVLYQRPDDGELLLGGHVTDDGRYLLLTASKGHTNQLHALALNAHFRPTGPLIPIAPTADARYEPIDTSGDILWLQTTSEAPNGRVVTVNLKGPARETWQTILPESANNLDSASLVANTLIATYLADAQSEVHLFTPAGQPLGPLELPAIGTVSAFSGRRTDTESFVTFTNFTTPPIILRLDLSSPVIPTGAAGEVEEPASRPTTKAVISTEAQPQAPVISTEAQRSGEIPFVKSHRTPAGPGISSPSTKAVISTEGAERRSGETPAVAPAQTEPKLTLTPFRSPVLTFNPADFLTTQVFFPSSTLR